MTRSAFAMLGLIVLGLAAAGALREYGPPRVIQDESPRPVPNLEFVDGAGALRSLAEFRGRVVLLNVWATWCPPCRREMPSLDRLQQALGGPDFEVVALSIDRGGVTVVKRFAEALELRSLRVYVDPSAETIARLGAPGIPVTLLVDRRGRELWRVTGPARWDAPEMIDRIRDYLSPRAES